jgi:hypothetical protein
MLAHFFGILLEEKTRKAIYNKARISSSLSDSMDRRLPGELVFIPG